MMVLYIKSYSVIMHKAICCYYLCDGIIHEIIYCNIYVMVSYITAYAVIIQEKYVIYVMLLYIRGSSNK